MLFRLPFTIDTASRVPIDVTADQRYELYLDGQRLGRGPMRGDLAHWQYESYEIALEPGKHLLAACVWWLPADGAPMAQMSGDPGFLLLAEGPLTEQLSTGAAPWLVSQVDAYERAPDGALGTYYVVGWSFTLDGHRYPWGWTALPTPGGVWRSAAEVAIPIGLGFTPPRIQRRPADGHSTIWSPPRCPACWTWNVPRASSGMLRWWSTLPWQRDPDSAHRVISEQCDGDLATRWQALLTDRVPLTVGHREQLHILVDLDNYYCAYPMLCTSGGDGATVSLGWSESLYDGENIADHRKGDRNAVDGRFVRCPYDTFILEGGPKRAYSTLWWRAGRYVDIRIETGDEPLTVNSLTWRETRYPLEMEAALETSDAAYNDVRPLMFRTLQMCAHETYMDCPYYEQFLYAGDTRIESAGHLRYHPRRSPARPCVYTL